MACRLDDTNDRLPKMEVTRGLALKVLVEI